MNYLDFLKDGAPIHIKKSHEGKFTDYCGGKVTGECIARGKRSPSAKIRKLATFALNARSWKHQTGGRVFYNAMDNENKEYIPITDPHIPEQIQQAMEETKEEEKPMENWWDKMAASLSNDSVIIPSALTGGQVFFNTVRNKNKLNIEVHDPRLGVEVDQPEQQLQTDLTSATTDWTSSLNQALTPLEQTSITGGQQLTTLTNVPLPTGPWSGFRDLIYNELTKLGYDGDAARVMVAQMGLETGHGLKVVGDYNYGNITKGSSWTGRTATRPGNHRIFRAYENLNQAMQDYVALALKYDIHPGDSKEDIYQKWMGHNNNHLAYNGKDNRKYISQIDDVYKMYWGNGGTQSTGNAPQLDNSQLSLAIQRWLGIPYVYGGGSRSGIDCSHFVSKVFNEMGKKVSAGSIVEWKEMDHVDLSQARVGDVIFLQGTLKKRAWGLPSHVAIITDVSQLPNGKITVAEASGGGKPSQVRSWNISSGYYKNHYLGVGRLRV